MPEKTPLCCPELSYQKMFTSDSWQHNSMKLHHPKPLQVARSNNLTIRSAPRHIEPTQGREFNAKRDSVRDLDTCPYLEHAENIADSESQPLPPHLLRSELFLGASALLFDYIAEPWECDTQGCPEMNLHNNPNYQFAPHNEYIYI
jgi:hypothetical protein